METYYINVWKWTYRRSCYGFKTRTIKFIFACPKYYPENRKEKERACANRLNLVDFEKMLDHMTEKIEKGMDQGIEVNLTGYQYRDRKGTQYTVLRHSKDDLKIEVLNRRALIENSQCKRKKAHE